MILLTYHTTNENIARLRNKEKKIFSSPSKSRLLIITNVGKKKRIIVLNIDLKPVNPNNMVGSKIITSNDIIANLFNSLILFKFIHPYVVLVV